MAFALRPVTTADFPAIHAVIRRCEVHDHVPIVTPLAELVDWVDEPRFDLAADARLVEADGDVVAWGRVWYRPGDGREERTFLHGGVDPARRGQGIGRALLAWQVERSSAIVRGVPGAMPRWVRAYAYEHQAASLALFARMGFAPVRYSDELRRDLAVLAAPPEVPGIAIIPWDGEHSEAARLAQNAAFADHWGSSPRDPAAWAHDLAAYGTRLDLSFYALDGAQVVGVCRNGNFPEEDAVTGRRDGWIFNLSVVRSHRRRGIAEALIARSLAAFAATGMTDAALGVDSENPTGAYGLYERLGFRAAHRIVICQRGA